MNPASLAGLSLNLNIGRGLPIKTAISAPIVNPNNDSAKRKRKGVFNTDSMTLNRDVRHPVPESVDLMNEITTEYILSMSKKAGELKKEKIQTEDILFHIRKDRKKFNRVKELLVMHGELKKAKKAFDTTDDPEQDEEDNGAEEGEVDDL
ncbi:transcription initiation factor TFIID subunit [Planoprotostelium fungivorum]|uniref:Transcription initiation factor TFIID subunit 13 n=1 Tax=Planoprotostelium fungivorum TaxID=1890364 RepID=A0A2P6NSN6_9EUKA|nr:transcription initiation factor TFIID subunit [Planoprotostelium fungivorum]